MEKHNHVAWGFRSKIVSLHGTPRKRDRRAARRGRVACRIAVAGLAVFAAGERADAVTVVPTYDSTVTSNVNSAAIQNAFNYVCLQYQNLYSDPINVNITVSVGTTGLGGSNTSILGTLDYATTRNSLISHATSANDTIANNSLPVTSPLPSGSMFGFPRAETKALGLIDNDTTEDGQYTFNGNFNFSFNPAARAAAGRVDFIGVSEHEVSEIMGRIPSLGTHFFGEADYFPYDLFRYTGAGARNLSDAAGVYFSIDGGATNLKNFNFASGNGSDPQDWASGSPDSYNAFGGNPNEMDPITPVDVTTLDVIGYNLASLVWKGTTNSTWDIFSTSNWANSSGTTMYTDSALVVFDDTGAAGSTSISLNQSVYTTSVTVNSNINNYSLNGTGGITGLGGLTKSGTSTLTINNSNSFTGPTSVTGGVLTLSATGALGCSSFTVSAGATMNVNGKIPANSTIAANGTVNFGGTTTHAALNRLLTSLSVGSGVTASVTTSTFPSTPTILNTTTLSFADSTAKLNLTNNELVFTGTAAAAKTQIVGGQIFTTSSGGVLGYADIGGGKVEVRFTILGDENLDGTVNTTDFAVLASNFNNTNQLWGQGDFNNDGIVNALDFNAIATNFGNVLAGDLPDGTPVVDGVTGVIDGQGVSGGGPLFANRPAGFVVDSQQLGFVRGSAVPEPASMVALFAGLLLPRRRRRD